MARPSKYTPGLRDQLAGYIGDGLTVRDACYGAGISEDTFWRWNREKLEFAEAIKRATVTQKWSSEALARTSEYRRYTRKAQICFRKALKNKRRIDIHSGCQKSLEGSSLAPEGNLNVALAEKCGLSIRTAPPEDSYGDYVVTSPYYNQTTNKVEWVTKANSRHVLHSCLLELWCDHKRRDAADKYWLIEVV